MWCRIGLFVVAFFVNAMLPVRAVATEEHETLKAPQPLPPPEVKAPPVPAFLADFPPDLLPPIVTIKVLAPALVKDRELEYKILVENRSPGAAHNVVILSRLPENVKFLRGSPEPHALQPDVTWKLNSLDGGAKCELKLTVQVTGEADVTNCVRVSYEHGAIVTSRICKSTPRDSRPDVPRGPDGRPIDPTVPAAQAAKLALGKTAPARLSFTRPIPYRIRITNESDNAASNVTLVDRLPNQTAFVSASDGGQLVGSEVRWSLGTLAARATKTVDLKLRPLAAGMVVNVSEATAERSDKVTTEARTEVVGEPGLLFQLVDTIDPVNVGEETVYVATLRNQGSAPLTNVKVIVDVPAEFVVDRVQASADFRKEGQSVSFNPINLPAGSETTYRIFVTARKAGDTRIKATVTGDQLTGGPVVEEEATHVFDAASP